MTKNAALEHHINPKSKICKRIYRLPEAVDVADLHHRPGISVVDDGQHPVAGLHVGDVAGEDACRLAPPLLRRHVDEDLAAAPRADDLEARRLERSLARFHSS